MNTNVNIFISFTAGILSFLTPCVLPLVPSYISVIGGMTFQDLKQTNYKRSILILRTLFFVAGFTIVYFILGIFLWSTFQVLSNASVVLNIIAGIVVILLGFNIIFDFLSFLNREKRVQLKKRPLSYVGALAAGMAFAAGWSPCLGPTVFGILSLTASGQSALGIVNLLAYSVGLGIPFILLSIAFIPVSRYLDKVKKHTAALRIASGVFLVLVGAFILFGQLGWLTVAVAYLGFFLEGIVSGSPLVVQTVTGIVFIILGLVPGAILFIKSALKHEWKISVRMIISLIFSALMFLLSVLELTGVISSLLLISRWLTG